MHPAPRSGRCSPTLPLLPVLGWAGDTQPREAEQRAPRLPESPSQEAQTPSPRQQPGPQSCGPLGPHVGLGPQRAAPVLSVAWDLQGGRGSGRPLVALGRRCQPRKPFSRCEAALDPGLTFGPASCRVWAPSRTKLPSWAPNPRLHQGCSPGNPVPPPPPAVQSPPPPRGAPDEQSSQTSTRQVSGKAA